MGYAGAPLDFPPRDLCRWEGRFDDPRHGFRTLYCAANPLTCLRETVARFRPSLKALLDFERFGGPSWSSVPMEWRRDNVLARCRLEVLSGELLRLDDPGLRSELEETLGGLLLKLGIEHLDLGEVQGRQRELTRAVARALYDRGAAGLIYSSRYDNQPCLALFEGRARLREAGPPRLLAGDLPKLEQVCRDFRIQLSAT